MNNGKGIMVGAVAVLALLALDATLPRALAADATTGAAPMDAPMKWHRGHGGPNGGGPMAGGEGAMMQVMHGLGLSDAQKQQIHALVASARGQWQAAQGSGLSDLPALGNPADPNHQAAVQSAKTRAAQRIQDWSDLEQQIYGVLTTEQRAKLPQLLTELQSRITARRSEWHSQQTATP